MIYRIRTMNLVPEKASAVRDVALRAAAYASERFEGIEVEILENVAGQLGQIHMVTRCASLAALEAYEAERREDAGWMALVEEVHSLFGAEKTVDHLLRTVAQP